MMFQRINVKYWVIAGGFFLLFAACSRPKVILDQQEFISLLIDMHIADATLSTSREYTPEGEKRNYAYYNGIFEKYNIDNASFDSCMYFYSSQPILFAKIYDAVIDSLNRKLTDSDRIVQELKALDSVNLYTGPDTLFFDAENITRTMVIDSIKPGLYKLSLMVKFDTTDVGKNNRIESWFISSDNKDTLKARVLKPLSDTVVRQYQWSQYIDTLYDRLEIHFLESDNSEQLKERSGKIWKVFLQYPYISSSQRNSLQKGLDSRRNNRKNAVVQSPVLPDRPFLKKRKEQK